MTLQTIVLGLAWFTLVNAVASLLSWLLASWFRSSAEQVDRTRRLALVRMFPACVSILFALAIFLPSHLVLEPADANESLGLLWYSLAGCGTVLLGRAAVRALTLWRAGRELLSDSHRSAMITAGVHQVEGIPGVSLAGVFKPRVLIGPEAARELTSAELDVAIAHELAHRDAGDNVTRASMMCAPDFFGGSRRARHLETTWHEAAESLADARAVDGDRVRALHLASALVKVARLSASATARPQPAWSTLNDPSLLERRVRRLVSGALTPAVQGNRGIAWALLTALGLIAAVPLFAGSLHRLTEYLVRLLP